MSDTNTVKIEEVKQENKCELTTLIAIFEEEQKRIEAETRRKLNINEKAPLRPPKQYKCSFCAEVFSKPCALGGHISKKHLK